MYVNIAWQDIDTALLNMDDTLLDLAFDNYFWQKLVSETRGAKNGVTPQEAMEHMCRQYHDVQHTLNWYRLDYWSRQLGLGVCAMIAKMGPYAVLRGDTIPFLEAPRTSGKQRILFTSVHPHNLAVRLEYTGLDACPDLLLSTRTFGYPKEDQWLWHMVAEATDLKAEKTLFIGDSEAVLDIAVQLGICYCPSVTNPDSRIIEKQYQCHPSPGDYRHPTPSLV